MGDGVLEELYIVARYLMYLDEDATFADLFIIYFGYITGRDLTGHLGPLEVKK